MRTAETAGGAGDSQLRETIGATDGGRISAENQHAAVSYSDLRPIFNAPCQFSDLGRVELFIDDDFCVFSGFLRRNSS